MKAFVWRIVYAAIVVVMFWLIFPLFMEVVGFAPGGSLLALMKICVGCIAVLYVLWGPEPPMPF
jgi:hypothetical protein